MVEFHNELEEIHSRSSKLAVIIGSLLSMADGTPFYLFL
jgi:hypothetical protein